MQGFKKSLVALLAVAMVLSMVGPVFAAPADVTGTKYEDAAVRLIALGIFKGDDKGNFNPDNPITRAEAVAVIIRALGLEKSADLMNGVTKFADVNADPGLQWATGAINVAVSSGIVNGYPNGNFGGRDNVTYAQLAKMILYALNYGVTVEGGVWPTAVLAKADDLDILDGITVVADAPITRGDAAKMLDNSLNVNSLKQTGYGDLKQFEETGDTMLKKLGLDELEGRVVAIPVSDSGLKDDELKLNVTKKNDEELKSSSYTDVYTELEGVDAQSFFGLEVTAWVNDDDEIVFVEKKTSDSDVYLDTIKEIKSGDKVKLQVADTDLKVSEDATIYVNYDEVDYDDLYPGLYGRFVKKNNEVAFAVLFDFEDEYRGGVVTSVDGDRIKYFTTSDKEKTLDLKDADAAYIYDATLTAIDVDDIEKDNVIYWYEDDDEYFIVVSANKAEGKLEKIKDNKLTIDGKTYNFEVSNKKFDDEEYPYAYATYSLNEDEEVNEYKGNVKDIEDLDGEEVIGLLDLKNYVRHLRGATGKTSGTQYGVVVGAPNDDEVTIFNKDGEEVKYAIEKRADYGYFSDFKFYKDYKDGLKYAVTSYEVTAASKIAESDDDDKVGLKYAAIVEYNSSGDPVVTLATGADQFKGVLNKEDDEEFVTVGGNGNKFFVDKDTVVIRTLDDEELDPEIIKWEDFKDLTIGSTDNSYAVVFGEKGKTADAIFFVQYDFKGWSADEYFAVVLDKPYYSGGNWKADLDVFEIGEKTYICKDSPDFKEGDIISFKLNAKGEIDKPTIAKSTGVVDDKYIEDGTLNVKIHTDAVIYQLDDGDIDREISIGDIDGKTVKYVADKGVAKAITYEKTKKTDPDPLVKGTVTYISATGFTVDNKTAYFTTDRTILRDKNGNILLTGKDLRAKLQVGDQVDVTATGTDVDEVKIVKTKAELELEAAVKAANKALEDHIAAGGKATNTEYIALQNALEADPQVKTTIEAATNSLKALTDAINAAKAAQAAYLAAGGNATDAEYVAVSTALAADPQAKTTIEAATTALQNAMVNLGDMAIVNAELAKIPATLVLTNGTPVVVANITTAIEDLVDNNKVTVSVAASGSDWKVTLALRTKPSVTNNKIITVINQEMAKVNAELAKVVDFTLPAGSACDQAAIEAAVAAKVDLNKVEVTSVTQQSGTNKFDVTLTAKGGTYSDTKTITVSSADVNAAKALVPTTLNPVQGTDTNVIDMVEAAIDDATIAVTIKSTSNSKVASDGTITYGAAETGDVVFTLTKNLISVDVTVSVVIPAP